MDTEYNKSLHRCCYFRNTFESNHAIYKTFLLWYINQILSNTVWIALQIKEKWLVAVRETSLFGTSISLILQEVAACSYPTMAAVGRVLCCGWVEALVDSVTSLPPFSQSKGSFSVMIRSFILFSNTDISSWKKYTNL